MSIRQNMVFLFNDECGGIRKKSILLYIMLLIYTVFVWLWAFYALHDDPFLFSTAVLAYTFGLRHAVDADHIAAIDNVTRKLMQEGKKPISLGFFFSMGHSTVVLIATIAVAMVTSTFMRSAFFKWHQTASVICTSISALFLFVIAIINLLIFFSIWRAFQDVRRGKNFHEEDIDELISHRGFLSRYFRAVFRFVTKSWQMYFVGFLFGIGFDTATEIALLGIAASQTLNGVSSLTILIFPALFTAGMTLIDTTDCMIMLGAYGWAFMKPMRKLYYNLIVTLVSVVVALFIGSLEVMGLVVEQFEAKGWIGDAVRGLNSSLNYLGYYIIAFFVFCWFVSIVIASVLRRCP
jgi:high-affinity nickel-transport protein